MSATLTPGTLRPVKPATATRPVERHWERLAPYGYVAPFYVLFLVFGLFPLLFTFYVALFDWNPIGDRTFVGLENFRQLGEDPRFWNALRNTFSIWIISTVPQLIIALILAQVLNNAFLRLANFFRMAMLLPYITSVAATAIVFAQLFNRDYGLLNWFLELLGFGHVDFMSTAVGSHVLISAMVIWRWFGYNTLLYLASLQAVPRDLYEAAAVDGAGPVKQFFHITLPSLRPVIVFTVIMSTIGGLQIFTEPLLLSNGTLTCGTARQCQTLSLFLFEQGFGSFKFGYGSAIGVALFAIIVIVAFINFLLSSRLGKKG
ncbi:sugar ABC transporter permease [Paenibacillus sp. TRM 82003]|uniref:carbohydrate ABC transporter permease n=1 Tax=Kineococcus sp. TRM81007 TaxID=2925831 RepID=UPI001F587146|nr:sugar ABC transporter permease [Kineococcus sp. TRM81007]MCI2238127.1 sugar ABC transporter permease [Kineococcus sp. TRM81007]MCI3920511.1 sugar ABC transporter permease [Paenibacillus sp. TRM 82003]